MAAAVVPFAVQDPRVRLKVMEMVVKEAGSQFNEELEDSTRRDAAQRRAAQMAATLAPHVASLQIATTKGYDAHKIEVIDQNMAKLRAAAAGQELLPSSALLTATPLQAKEDGEQAQRVVLTPSPFEAKVRSKVRKMGKSVANQNGAVEFVQALKAESEHLAAALNKAHPDKFKVVPPKPGLGERFMDAITRFFKSGMCGILAGGVIGLACTFTAILGTGALAAAAVFIGPIIGGALLLVGIGLAVRWFAKGAH